MASEERRAADNKIMEDNLFKALGPEEEQAETEAFQCGRCKEVNTLSIFSLQMILIQSRGNAAIDKHKHEVLMSQ